MKSTNYQRANGVWRNLTGEGGELVALLSPVSLDNRSEVGKVRELLDTWNPQYSIDIINQINRELEKSRVTKALITGNARNWLLKGIDDARSIAEEWSRFVKIGDEIAQGSQNTYLVQQVTDLRRQIQEKSELVQEALTKLSSDSTLLETTAAALCARRSLNQLFAAIDIACGEISPVSHTVGTLQLVCSTTGNLSLAIARRLLWADHRNLTDEGVPIPNALNAVVIDLADSLRTQRSLQEAIERQLSAQDYRFVDSMISGVSKDDRAKYRSNTRRAKQDSLATLHNHVNTIQSKVNQAARDGAIETDDQNWVAYHKTLQAVSSQEDVLNFRELFVELEDLEKDLEKQSDKRFAELCEEWVSVSAAGEGHESGLVSAWIDKFKLAKGKKDIRVMEECLMRLRVGSVLESHQDIGSLEEPYGAGKDSLAGFISFSESIRDIERYTRSSDGLRALQSSLSMVDERSDK